ncbi:MAG: HlyD family secretion protein [Thermonemataceae bacterium]
MRNSLCSLVVIAVLSTCQKSDQAEANKRVSSLKAPSEVKVDVIIATGRVVPERDIIEVSTPTGGVVKAVMKKEGDQVSQNDILVLLEDDIARNKLKEIQTQIQSQQSQIAIERVQLREVQINLLHKNSLLTKTKRLLEKGAETQQVYDDLLTEVSILEITLQKAKVKIQAAVSKVNELKALLNTAQAEVKERQLLSPSDGLILNMLVNKGEAINQYATYAAFAPKGSLIVRAEVDELFSARVKKGQKVEIVNTGSDQVIASGEITLVAPYLKKKSLFSEKSDEQEDRRVREVKIALDSEKGLIINAKVECKIKL